MIIYTNNDSSVTGPNGEVIPKDEGNRHYIEMLSLLESGEATLVEAPVDLEAVKLASCGRIDNRAEALRQKVLTPGAGQMAAYQEKEIQAADLLKDSTPTEAEYPDIFNEIGITADSAGEVASAILRASEKWRTYGRAIEKTRLTAKKAINLATTPEEVSAIESGIVWP
jgi:hypothetical protein